MATNTTNNQCHDVNIDTQSCQVLVIGAGLAGLTTALCLPKDLDIIVLAKEDLASCSSHYAQGGIAASLSPKDSVSQHVLDTLVAGDGLCDDEATTHILSQGREAIEWLLKQGVPFSLHAKADLSDGVQTSELHLTQEGGHGRRRVAHADDATGKHIMQTLHHQLALRDNIRVLTEHEALELITDTVSNTTLTNKETEQTIVSPRVQGALVLDTSTGHLLNISADSVVLASGGLGQLFKRATAPEICVGDGIMMAWHAGCRLANLEFVQFHPTGLVSGDSNFLISEAVRGEGGRLFNPKTGERFMPRYDARAELAPRDVVARAIAQEMLEHKLEAVHLDISHQPTSFVTEHFPDIHRHCLQLSIDITSQPIPVAPTAHYTCGGVMTDTYGQTDVAGLYAVGEVAHTGLHGANRLASNSLLECVVVGREVATHLPRYLKNLKSSASNILKSVSEPKGMQPDHDNKSRDDKRLDNDNYLTDANSLLQQRMALKTLMSDNMGIYRTQKTLSHALEQIHTWQTQNTHSLSSNTFVNAEFLQAWRWQRLLTLCELMVLSALAREESRGGHYREDYPTLNDSAQLSVVLPKQKTSQLVGSKKVKQQESLSISLVEESHALSYPVSYHKDTACV